MQEFNGLTSSDFRNAWPEAYRHAILQVVLLQQQCEQQLGRATAQAMWSRQTAEATIRQLKLAQTTLTEALCRATHDGHDALRLMAEGVEQQTQDLTRREREFADARVAQQLQFRTTVLALRRNYLCIIDAPMLTRLRWALGTRKHRIDWLSRKSSQGKR